jgi:hypothetical protein
VRARPIDSSFTPQEAQRVEPGGLFWNPQEEQEIVLAATGRGYPDVALGRNEGNPGPRGLSNVYDSGTSAVQPLSPATPFPQPQPQPPQSRSASDELDPELLELPAPPRRERTLTLAVLAVTAVACFAMAFALRVDAAYAFSVGAAARGPVDLGDLSTFSPAAAPAAGSFVKASGLLGASAAIRYERAFVSDTFRVQPALGRKDLFVELRVPEGQETPRYVPPTSFSGRLVKLSAPGIRHRGLAAAIEAKTGMRPTDDAYLLVDGEEPQGARGPFGLLLLFVGFGLWNVLSIFRLVRPAR